MKHAIAYALTRCNDPKSPFRLLPAPLLGGALSQPVFRQARCGRLIKSRLIVLAMLLGAYGGAAAQTEIPQSIQPPPESRVKLQALAKGEQIYQCTFSAGQFQWQLKAPDALLLDTQGKEIGRHYAGPVWEHRDGSLITGKILRKLDAPPGKAIPWLLLETVQHKGSGTFAEIRYINRVETQGGLPPAKRCDGNRLGGEKRVPYRAVYFFYTTRNSDGNG